MKCILIFCLCFSAQAQTPITRNPFTPLKKKMAPKEVVLATAQWHDLQKQAFIMHDGEAFKISF